MKSKINNKELQEELQLKVDYKEFNEFVFRLEDMDVKFNKSIEELDNLIKMEGQDEFEGEESERDLDEVGENQIKSFSENV